MPSMDVTEMAFAKVYALRVTKAEKKGRTRDEMEQITAWLTGYTPEELAGLEQSDVSYGDFFRNAPAMHPYRKLITGKICGIRMEESRTRSCGTSGISISWWTSRPRANPWRRSCGHSCRLLGDPLKAKSPYTVLANRTA